MRILYLTPGCFDKGGISRYSRYQIEALREIHGVDNVRVMSLLGPGGDSFEENFETYWHGRGDNTYVDNRDRIEFAIRTLALVALWRPDIIHSAHVNFGPLVIKAARLAGAKTVLNVYGLEIWSGLSARRKAHMARLSAIIADCHFTARYVEDEELHAQPPTVIWDCVDLERFTPNTVNRFVLEKYGIPDPKKHFLVVSLGRLAQAAAHKGFDRLIKVIAPLAHERPELRLVIAGNGDDRLRLEALAKDCGIEKQVVFSGSVDEADLPEIYRAAHVFSLVSDRGHGRGEGIPLTPLEAMACGVPILVGNQDGSQEAVVAERNGFVIPPHDEATHRAALLRLMDNPELRKKMSNEACRVAREYFSYRQFVEKHRNFYIATHGRVRE